MTKSRLKVLRDLTTGERERIWKAAELARIQLRQAQRDCFIPDPFRYDSSGLRLNADRATEVSIEYAQAVLRAVITEYLPKGRSPHRLGQLLMSACKFVFSEVVASWKGLDTDARMSLESVCLPKVRAALSDRRDEVIADLLGKRNLLDKVPKDDPNYETAKQFYHQTWADSHALNAKAFAGEASFTDLVDGCVLSFQQGASTLLAIKDESTLSAKCIQIDDLAERFVYHFKKRVATQSKRLGKVKVKAINDDFFRRVNEIASRTKQEMHEMALAEGTDHEQGTEVTKEQPVDALGGGAPTASAGSTAPQQNMPVARTLTPITGIGGIRRRSTRAIKLGIASNQVVEIVVPKMTYEYSEHFPELARRKLLAARLRAENTLKDKREGVRDFEIAEGLLCEFILDVFKAFVEEGHRLGMQELLTAAQLESECLKFLHGYSVEAGLFDGGFPPGVVTEVPGDVSPRIERSEQYRKYRQLLQEIADAQANDEPASLAAQQQVVAGDGDEPQTQPLSLRDAEIHDIIGEANFTGLTNAEIMKVPAIRMRLNKDFQLEQGQDASKSCLDRIRRAKAYPLSRQVAEKRSRPK